MVKDGLKSRSQDPKNAEETDATITEVSHLFRQAEAVLAKIQTFLDKLLGDSSIDAGLNSKRRLRWLKHYQSINRLRRTLKDLTARICALLILKHLYDSPYTMTQKYSHMSDF